MVEKAKSLTMSGAKKNEYGDSGKYVSFTDGDGKRLVSVSTRKQLIMTLLLPDTTCLLHLNLIWRILIYTTLITIYGGLKNPLNL